jgi:rifampicin phosphotransferase
VPHDTFIVAFADASLGSLALVGGKGANLGALTRAGLQVPPGFCVATPAFSAFISGLADSGNLFAALDVLDGQSIEKARAASQAIRAALATIAMPTDIREAILAAWNSLGAERPLAVRSSATAEDLPGASFAGQQDTYLNVRGAEELIEAVRQCWISLFTDRAVLYRARNRFGHRSVKLAVVVQQLIDPDVSGILFTADPITGHRERLVIDAGFGLGEALVSGLINADSYQFDRRARAVLLARPGEKAFAIRSNADGSGTHRQDLPDDLKKARVLSDDQVVALAEVGEKIEKLYEQVPQDIEWCIQQNRIYVVQARPITSLYPLPEPSATEPPLRVFLSMGHFQMMTDALPKLASEVWRYLVPIGKGHTPGLNEEPTLSSALVSIGGRLYLDATSALALSGPRKAMLRVLSLVYEDLAKSAQALATQVPLKSGLWSFVRSFWRHMGPVVSRVPGVLFFRAVDPLADATNSAYENYLNEARHRILSESSLAGRLRQALRELNSFFFNMRAHFAMPGSGVVAHRWLASLAKGRWAHAVRPQVDELLRGLPRNVGTELALEVGDLTDVARKHPEVSALIHRISEPHFSSWGALRALIEKVAGGPAFLKALDAFLTRYGDRGASEFDVARPRWKDNPVMLLRTIVGGLGAESGAHRSHHQIQIECGERAAESLVAAARHGLSGVWRAPLVRRLSSVARAGQGLREHHKFAAIRVVGLLRDEVVSAGCLLAENKQLEKVDQVFHLAFGEIESALIDRSVDLRPLVARREEEHRRNVSLKSPLAMSSLGECPSLAIDRAGLPKGALSGTAASAGVVEGLARVIRDPNSETIQAGEILVAPFTDPGWTPLFVHAAGVVTEVGGLMTHGAVVAREYGIPAVVSVSNALSAIKTGQRIRVDGTRGFVEVLEPL